MRSIIQRRKRGRSAAVLLMLLMVWSILLGWGMALALNAAEKPNVIAQGTPVALGTVDYVPERYQTGLKLYLENCGSCHVALPPEVMPTDTWRTLLLEPEQHYGQQLKQISRPFIFIVWDYLRAFSRPLVQEEQTPFRLTQSPYFKALHPRVELPRTVNATSCVSCHQNARDYDYRTLTAEWEDSP
ncbi:cytochrome C [Coleofasciculus sp. LEGE 07092]|uniref:cytochrome C n=2 Tax=unclassified Coleofasciculus TaxID=2692782 RepID=UPI002AD4D86F|nr:MULTISPECIES: cytochrome C [unclassified Coleofasciculus]